MKNLSIIFAIATLFALAGCGNHNANQAAMAQKLNGKIDGEPWTHTFGVVRPKLGSSSYSITLHNLPDRVDPCTATYVPGQAIYMVSFSVKELTAGAYDVSAGSGSSIYLTRAVTTSGNFSATSKGAFGEARLTKVDANTVEGQLDVSANDSNFVKGTFTAKICK